MAPPQPRWVSKKKPIVPKAAKLQKARTQDENVTAAPVIPLELQQLLLNIFKASFAERFDADIKPLLQEVKSHLYNRDFATAFGKQEYLEAYAARWSPSRALGYAELFWDLKTHLWPDKRIGEIVDEEMAQKTSRKVVCLGGGAGAELVALAGVQRLYALENESTVEVIGQSYEVVAIDIADWTSVVNNIAKQATTAPPISKYASAAVKAANIPLADSSTFGVSFHQQDILGSDFTVLATLLEDVTLVTLLFTLNELYSTSLALTQTFLLNLTATMPKGAVLLVVDSPGSYSSITLNGAEKKYPMQWLLDHTLLEQASGNAKESGNADGAKWEKAHEEERRWFRLDASLAYPIDLENMRMQVHLYRRL
jgi:25S rRNA (uracil2843-N3)-methyltransferase